MTDKYKLALTGSTFAKLSLSAKMASYVVRTRARVVGVHMAHTRAGRRAFAEFPVSEELGTEQGGNGLEATPAFTYPFIYSILILLPYCYPYT